MNESLKLKLIIVFSLAGIGISSYLILHHYGYFVDLAHLCNIADKVNCDIVNFGPYSEIFGIPTASFGLVWFISVLMIAAYSLKNKDMMIYKFLFIWSIVAVAFAGYLIYLEIFVIQYFCLFCTTAHALGILIFILAFSLRKAKPSKIQEAASLKESL